MSLPLDWYYAGLSVLAVILLALSLSVARRLTGTRRRSSLLRLVLLAHRHLDRGDGPGARRMLVKVLHLSLPFRTVTPLALESLYQASPEDLRPRVERMQAVAAAYSEASGQGGVGVTDAERSRDLQKEYFRLLMAYENSL